MHINFIHLGEADLASFRFRVLAPYDTLTSLGHKVTIKKFPDEKADVNVFQKHIEPEKILKWMQATKKPTIFDVCDDHFDREWGSYYKQACSLAKVLTCTNSRMEKRLKELFPKKQVNIVNDPVNTLYGPPKKPVEQPKVIWFGHSTNFGDATPWLTEVVNAGFNLTVVSNLPNLKGGDFTFIPYQQGWVEENLRNYDVVILPTGDAPFINMKSENRFVDALNAGCCVITNNDVLYKDLLPFGIYETGSVVKGLEKYKAGAYATEKGQVAIKFKYSEEKMREQWNKLLGLI